MHKWNLTNKMIIHEQLLLLNREFIIIFYDEIPYAGTKQRKKIEIYTQNPQTYSHVDSQLALCLWLIYRNDIGLNYRNDK